MNIQGISPAMPAAVQQPSSTVSLNDEQYREHIEQFEHVVIESCRRPF